MACFAGPGSASHTVARARCSASWGLCSSTHGTDRFGSPNQHQQLHCIAVASASATDIRTSGKTGLPQHDPERSSCWARTSCTLSRHASCAPQPTQRAFFQARPRNFSRKLYCKKSWQNASEIKKICAQGKTRAHKRLQAVWLTSKHRQWQLPHHASRAAQAAYEETSG